MKTVAGLGQSQNENILFHHHSSLQLHLQRWVGVQTKISHTVQRPSSNNIWWPAALEPSFLSVSAPTEVFRWCVQTDTGLLSPLQESGAIWVAAFPDSSGCNAPGGRLKCCFLSDGGLCHMSHSALFSLTHFFCMRRAACPDCACVCDFFFNISVCVHPMRKKNQTLVTSLKDEQEEHKQYPAATFESCLNAHFLNTNGSVGVELLPALRVYWVGTLGERRTLCLSSEVLAARCRPLGLTCLVGATFKLHFEPCLQRN